MGIFLKKIILRQLLILMFIRSQSIKAHYTEAWWPAQEDSEKELWGGPEDWHFSSASQNFSGTGETHFEELSITVLNLTGKIYYMIRELRTTNKCHKKFQWLVISNLETGTKIMMAHTKGNFPYFYRALMEGKRGSQGQVWLLCSPKGLQVTSVSHSVTVKV